MGYKVVKTDVVGAALARLLGTRINPAFSGYLCMKRTARRDGRTTNLRPKFKGFFNEFFAVEGNPARPYLRPFWNQKLGAGQQWYQKNVAGGFSPKSISRLPAIYATITLDMTERPPTYSFKPDHADIAMTTMLESKDLADKRVPVVPLAVFLYRDFGIDDAEGPTAATLVSIFRDEFGYRANEPTESGEFDKLFLDESGVGDSADWFVEAPHAS